MKGVLMLLSLAMNIWQVEKSRLVKIQTSEKNLFSDLRRLEINLGLLDVQQHKISTSKLKRLAGPINLFL